MSENQDNEIITDYEKTSQQIAEEKIREIKRKAKEDIAEIKHNLILEKLADNNKAIDKACKKENRRRYREAKRIEYVNRKNRYSLGEEIFNSVSHGIGAGLAVAATVLLIIHAIKATEANLALRYYYVVSFSIFGGALILLYLMSTLYHGITPIKAKKVLAILDHVYVYVLIAATYTPFCLGVLHNALGWTIFGIIWGLAILGIVFYSIYGSRMRLAAAITYILMGWLIVFALGIIKDSLAPISLVFLLVGGVTYTVGAIFYFMKSVKWMHSIWHLFVIAGSVLHFFSVYFTI